MNTIVTKRAGRFVRWWGKPIREGVSLRRYSSFSIGGKADLFIHVRSEEELIRAVQGAVRFKLPYVVIGLGTNILVSDEGFRGLVIRNYSPKKVHVEGTKLWAPSVVSLSRVVEAACLHGLTGMEFATGIPGTMGGAIYING